ncbi:MAG: DUF167 domain-containing protein [Patescibacteria group bacterium]
MKIFVKAKPNTKEEKVEKISETNFIVAIKKPPIQGKANTAIVKALAKYFGIASSRIVIISGIYSKQKVFEII